MLIMLLEQVHDIRQITVNVIDLESFNLKWHVLQRHD